MINAKQAKEYHDWLNDSNISENDIKQELVHIISQFLQNNPGLIDKDCDELVRKANLNNRTELKISKRKAKSIIFSAYKNFCFQTYFGYHPPYYYGNLDLDKLMYMCKRDNIDVSKNLQSYLKVRRMPGQVISKIFGDNALIFIHNYFDDFNYKTNIQDYKFLGFKRQTLIVRW